MSASASSWLPRNSVDPENEQPEPAPAEIPDIAWRGIFEDYRAAMDGTTEASDVAHFATLWAALAVALGRNVSMYSGDVIYPNVYLSIYGGTGDKKTTAERRLSSCGLLDDHPTVRLVRDSGTTEGFADALSGADGGVYLFMWEEFASLLSRARWGGSTLLEFMTETFDCPEHWSLKYRKNPVLLTKPTPTILTATTVEWFWKYAKPEDFFGGFGNRFLFMTGLKKPPIPNPKRPDAVRLQHVKRQLQALAELRNQEARWTPTAQQLWDAFYVECESRERKGLVGAALKRAHVYVRKLAMTYAAAERCAPNHPPGADPGVLYIDADQLRAALAVILYASHCTEALIELQSAQCKPLGELEQVFLKWIAGHEGERLRVFQQRMWKVCGDSETFNRVRRNLELADRIEIRDGRVFLSR